MKEGRSKSPLVLMEQAIMILVFSVAAVLCVQAFVHAELSSQQLYRRDMAAERCQTAAETVKAKNGVYERAADLLGGELSEGRLLIYYNEDWETVTSEEGKYVLSMENERRDPYVTTAKVCITEKESGKEVFSLPVSWQEVLYE